MTGVLGGRRRSAWAIIVGGFLLGLSAWPARASVEEVLRREGFASAPIEQLRGRNADVVRVAINGHEFRLVIDTGTPNTLLFRHAAERAGLAIDRTLGPAYGVNGMADAAASLARVASFSIGGIALPPTPILIAEFHPTVINGGEDFDGLLGLRTLQRIGAVFGYDSAVLFFRPSGFPTRQLHRFFPSVGFAEVSPLLSQGRYLVSVSVNGVPATMMLDSGASTTLLDRRYIEKAGLPPARGVGWGVGLDGHQILQNGVRTQALAVGGVPLPLAVIGVCDPAVFRPRGGTAAIDGLLGFEPLRRLRPYVDAGNDRLYLDTMPGRR